jgi:tricorn protease-like protein
MIVRFLFSRLGMLAALCAIVAGGSLRAEEPVSFRRDIAPLLIGHCQACHGPKKAEGAYRVDSHERALAEGESVSPGFAPMDLDASEAYRRMTSEDKDERMPKDAEALSAEQLALFKRWIEEGARFDGPDAKASLASIVPPPTYPDPPEAYSRPILITAATFSPAGNELFVSGYHEITVWNPTDGSLLRRIKNVGERTYDLQFSPDGKLLAAASGAPGRMGEVRLYDPATGNLIKVLGSTIDVVFSLAFNPAGDRLAAGGADSAIRIYDIAAGTEVKAIEVHSDWVMAVAYAPDGKQIAAASRDKTAKVFDADSGKALSTFTEHNAPVQGVLFTADGKQVYSSGDDRKVRLWNSADGKQIAEIAGFGGQVFKLTAGGEFFFAPSADKTVKQYELASQKLVRSYSGHKEWVLSAAYHAGTQRLAGGGFDGEVRIWNTADGMPVVNFFAVPGYVPKP